MLGSNPNARLRAIPTPSVTTKPTPAAAKRFRGISGLGLSNWYRRIIISQPTVLGSPHNAAQHCHRARQEHDLRVPAAADAAGRPEDILAHRGRRADQIVEW